MIKKIKLINKILKLADLIQKIIDENKDTVAELFKILDKIRKVSPELAEIIYEIKGLF